MRLLNLCDIKFRQGGFAYHRQWRGLAKGDGWSNMYTVYVIKSENADRFYIGYTNNVEKRLRHHNSGATKSTRPYRPWSVVYTEVLTTKREAWLREQQIKRYKGGEAFKRLLQSGGFA